MNELNVLPCSAPANVVNMVPCDAHYCCNFILPYSIFPEITYFANLIFSELNVVCLFTARCVLSAFGTSIIHVVLMRTQKQMLRIAAWWIIAFVQNMKSVWNWAIVNFVRKSMGFGGYIFDVERAISGTGFGSSPQPAFVRAALIHFFPKAFSDRAAAVMAREKPNWHALDQSPSVICCCRERYALTTSAHAQAAGVWLKRGRIGAHKKFTFLVSKPRVLVAPLGTFYWFALD